MSRGPSHYMRMIRVQLKTGYIKEEPEVYTFMKKNPPLVTSIQAAKQTISISDIPYANLYRKAMHKNPLLADEASPRAYDMLETRALALAKVQYQHMQKGLSEDDAYQKAWEYVDQQEDKAYQELKDIYAFVDKIRTTETTNVITNPQVAIDFKKWQDILHETPYESLSRKDKGELDYFLQTSLLGWNPLERQRRMIDPLFYRLYVTLRKDLFPKNPRILEEEQSQFRQHFKENFLAGYDIPHKELKTKKPFYLEDYLYYLTKLTNPATANIKLWNKTEQDSFYKWIEETLAYETALSTIPSMMRTYIPTDTPMTAAERNELQAEDAATVNRVKKGEIEWQFQDIQEKLEEQRRSYLGALQAQYFPMIFFNQPSSSSDDQDQEQEGQQQEEGDRVRKYTIPSIQEVKAMLYQQDIGYKKEKTNTIRSNKDGEKLFIQRFYRLPFLLFPHELFVGKLMREEIAFGRVLESDEYLKDRMIRYGLSGQDFFKVKSLLEDHLEKIESMRALAEFQASNDKDGPDTSVLDEILMEAEDGDGKGDNDFDLGDSDKESEEEGEEEDDEDGEKEEVEPERKPRKINPNAILLPEQGSPAWEKVVNKFVKLPTTALEMERMLFMEDMGGLQPLERCVTEDDLYMYQQEREQLETITRASLARKYEIKEGARLQRANETFKLKPARMRKNRLLMDHPRELK